MNIAIILGNLGQDPELNFTSGGTPVCNLSVATNRVWYNKDKEKQEEVEWHRVVVWGKQAESCKEYLAKGRQVAVRGRIATRKWEDKDGNPRQTSEIVAEEVKFVGSKGGSSGGRRSDAPPPISDDDIPF